MDSEEEFYAEEISKLKTDVEQEGLGLIVFGEWYNVDTMIKMKFFDDNTRSWWTPVTGDTPTTALSYNDQGNIGVVSHGDCHVMVAPEPTVILLPDRQHG